jgi:hypothetical protein
VLEELKEWFLDAEGAGENINATDHSGWTALHFAAQVICPDGIELLLSWGAEMCPARPVHYKDMMNPYDLALVQASYGLTILSTSKVVDGSGGTLAMGMNQPLPIETSSLRSAYGYMPKVGKALALLSTKSSKRVLPNMWGPITGQSTPDILGLEPSSVRTRRILTRLSRGLVQEHWGVYPSGEREIRAHVCERIELSPIDLALKIAQCTQPVESDIIGGASFMDDRYVYRFKLAESKEVYENSPFEISETLQKFLFEGSRSHRTDAEGSETQATSERTSGVTEGTRKSSGNTVEKKAEEKGESSDGEIKTAWI